MSNPIRIILIEDHPGYRESLRLSLETETDIELVNEFGTAERALRNIAKLNELNQPDVILLDLNLPGASGLEVLAEFRKEAPNTRIIVLTQSAQEEDVLKAIAAGASGYLLKSATIQEIVEGIRVVVDGGASLDPNIAQFVLKNLEVRLPKGNRIRVLTDREMEVLTLIAKGLVKKEIAAQLGIAPSTVATHTLHIYEKLGEPNAPSAVHKAHRLGLFKPVENDID